MKILFFILIAFSSAILHSAEKLVFTAPVGSLLHTISIKVLTEAYRKIGYEVEILRQPSQRGLITSNSGVADGEVSRVKSINKVYTNLIRVPVVINLLEGFAFSKKEDVVVSDWSSLKNYDVICVRGVKFYEKLLTDRNIDCQQVSVFEQAIRMIQIDRGDVVISSKISGLNYIRKLNASDINIAENPLISIELYHYLHKKNESLVTDIQTVLETMVKNGRVSEIRDEYIQEINYRLLD